MLRKLLTFVCVLIGVAAPATANTFEETWKYLINKTDPNLTAESYQIAGTCFASGEQTSGMNKICYYDCTSGTVAITIKSYKLCPLSIKT